MPGFGIAGVPIESSFLIIYFLITQICWNIPYASLKCLQSGYKPPLPPSLLFFLSKSGGGYMQRVGIFRPQYIVCIYIESEREPVHRILDTCTNALALIPFKILYFLFIYVIINLSQIMSFNRCNFFVILFVKFFVWKV